MSFQRSSTDGGTKGVDSLYGESSHDGHEADDERTLYGEPCHETVSGCDEQTLYGEPQHETHDEDRELPDLELLFAQMRAESGVDSTVLSLRSEASPVETTEL